MKFYNKYVKHVNEKSVMNAIEKGEYYPSVKLCIEICKVLGNTVCKNKKYNS